MLRPPEHHPTFCCGRTYDTIGLHDFWRAGVLLSGVFWLLELALGLKGICSYRTYQAWEYTKAFDLHFLGVFASDTKPYEGMALHGSGGMMLLAILCMAGKALLCIVEMFIRTKFLFSCSQIFLFLKGFVFLTTCTVAL